MYIETGNIEFYPIRSKKLSFHRGFIPMNATMLVVNIRWYTSNCIPTSSIFIDYPLVNQQFAIENGHLELIYPFKMVVVHRYIYIYICKRLPDGK